MLLFDRIMQLRSKPGSIPSYRHHMSKHVALPTATVFELTDMRDHRDLYHQATRAGLPFRPPYPLSWCEFDDYGTTVGTLLIDLTDEPAANEIQWDGRDSSGSKNLVIGYQYCCGRDKWHVSTMGGYLIFGMDKEYNPVSWGVSCPDESKLPDALDLYRYPAGVHNVIPLIDSSVKDKMGELFAWMLSCLALLSCRNVTTKTVMPDERKQNRIIRQGQPPRVSYKVLSVNAPSGIVTSGASSRSKCDLTRLHTVRGHFKNLSNGRYKNKGWHWWPAHVRGNPELGAVVKDYRVKPGEGANGKHL